MRCREELAAGQDFYDIYHAQIMDGDVPRHPRQHSVDRYFHTGGVPAYHDIDRDVRLIISSPQTSTGSTPVSYEHRRRQDTDPTATLAKAIEISADTQRVL
jgi:hypothetical protein